MLSISHPSIPGLSLVPGLPLVLVLALLAGAAVSPLAAQTPSSPHDPGPADSVRTLDPSEIDDLLSGAGMGMARAAEFNSYPGPLHVLELADSLTLTPEQRAVTEDFFDAMRAEAIARGHAILAAEQELDAMFAAGSPEADLEQQVERIGELRGGLRWVHLRTHLRMREVLTPHQVRVYDRLRGYGADGG